MDSSAASLSGSRDRPGIHCVFLTCFLDEWRAIATLLQYGRIRSHRAETTDQADFLLTVTGSTVLLSDILFLDGSWADALRMCADLHPGIAPLVVAEPEDRAFASEALVHGAFGILWKPLSILRVQRLIQVADEAAHERMHRPPLPLRIPRTR